MTGPQPVTPFNHDECWKLQKALASDIAQLRKERDELREVVEAFLEGRPIEPPPEIMRGGTAWRNWELFERARAVLANLNKPASGE